MVKKILSIDGGGIKGVFPASFLASIEDSIDGNIGQYFDLIVGTSTGGIIALGLGLGLSAKEILKFYEEHGPNIFRGNRLLKHFRHFTLAKYKNKELKSALEQTFQDKKLGDSLTRLVIPSFNLETGEVYVHKTCHHRKFERDFKKSVVDVAMATSAAPTFFPTYINSYGTPLIDGGIWANNPVGMAVVEAVGVLDWSRDSTKVLSVGCTTEPINIRAGRNRALGILYWIWKLPNVFMIAQSSASVGTAALLVGHDNIKRISPVVSSGKFGLDVVREINRLKGLGDSEARKEGVNIQSFFAEKAEVFEPYK